MKKNTQSSAPADINGSSVTRAKYLIARFDREHKLKKLQKMRTVQKLERVQRILQQIVSLNVGNELLIETEDGTAMSIVCTQKGSITQDEYPEVINCDK